MKHKQNVMSKDFPYNVSSQIQQEKICLTYFEIRMVQVKMLNKL